MPQYLCTSMQRVVEAIENESALLRLAAAKFHSEAEKREADDPDRRIFQIKRVVALAEAKGKTEAANRMGVVLRLYQEVVKSRTVETQ